MEKIITKHKEMKIKNYLMIGAAGLMTFAAVSCTDLGPIEKDLDALESRVTALETQIKTLNENIIALQGLRNATTIKSATHDATKNTWTVELSDGTILTLNDGVIGEGKTPALSINKEGYWTVDYKDGKGYVLVKDAAGNPVKALGTDGKTPVFGVDANGYWTVDYGTGATQVKDASGKPVKASASDAADSFFEDVKLSADGKTLEIKLKGDTKYYTLPIVSDFWFNILDNGAAATGCLIALITDFKVDQSGVASAVIVAKPSDSWAVVLEGATLTVTAPAASTKAVAADSRTDIAILAVSEKGFTTTAKIKVALNDAPIEVHPAASVSFTGATETTLSFSVTATEFTGCKYVIKSDETVPTAEEISTGGTAIVFETGAATASFTVAGLTGETTYKVFVLPYNGDVLGALVSAEGRTLEGAITDFYEAWEKGKDIVIAGVTYNKETNGEATLLSSTVESPTNLRISIHQKGGVFFLENEDKAYFEIPSVTEIKDNVVIIGRYPGKKANILPKMCMKLIAGSLTLYNLAFNCKDIKDGVTNGTYLCNNANSTSNFSWYIDSCDFMNMTKPMLYANTATYTMENLVVKNSSFGLNTSATVQIFNYYKCSVMNQCKQMVFDNNIVYNKVAGDVQVFQWDQTTSQSTESGDYTISMCNNSFYNCPSKNAYIKGFGPSSVKIKKNICHGDPATITGSYLYLIIGAWSKDNLVAEDNIVYGLTKNWQIAHSDSTVKPATENTLTKETESPYASVDLENGILTPKAEYSSYGAQR